ncbi:SMC family ATPase [Capnocytophaga sp. G2]|uniref:SMC family ATPase n=1 Tax=Capnocytophaga sp. G2 TaxID=3110695 RepID=UPI002B49EF0E|nr:SMC family ATPase [Capnocytophaga sp. G2]MEB3004327.1 SMC family ATPase [Capnocytophaga sp. G2]
MLPLYLTIEGIYSYQKRQEIDFSLLTEAGLFGIFGAVGSGKSSILEAITFALYGRTERLNSVNDKRNYNMLNLKSNRFYIDFEFLNFENKIFRVVREYKRNSKNFNDVKSPTVQFYENKNKQWIPLENANPQDIIGLSYNNFKRTIIIPQGQFKEFLELGAKDRTEMMKEIFNLQKFDLSENIAKIKKENGEKLSFKEGQLKGLDEINEENIQFQKEKLDLEKEKQKTLKTQFIYIKSQYEQLKILKSDYELLNKKKDEFSSLDKQKVIIDALEIKVNTYERIERLFKNLLDNKEKIQNEVNSYKVKKETEVTKLKEIREKIANLNQRIESIQKKFNQLSQTKIVEDDLKQILSIIPLQKELITEEENAQKGKNIIEEEERMLKEQKKTISSLEINIETLKKQQIDNKILLEVGNWYEKYHILKENRNKQINKISTLKKQLQDISKDLDTFTSLKNEIPSDYKEKIDKRKELLQNEKQTLSQKISQLEVQCQLAHYSQGLHKGVPCPLCGSLEHPHIPLFEDVSNEIASAKESIKNIEIKQERLQQTLFQIEKYIDRKKIFDAQLSSERNIFTQIEKDISEHTRNFTWKEFSIDDHSLYLQKQKLAADLESKIEEKETSHKKILKEVENLQEKLKKYRDRLSNIHKNIASLQGNISSKKENIKILSFNDYLKKEYTLIEKEYQERSLSNKQTEEIYLTLTEEKNNIIPLESQYDAHLKNTNELLDKWEEELSSTENTLEKVLKQEQIKFEDVKTILSTPIAIEENQVKIQTFRVHYKSLQEQIKELEMKFNQKSFSYQVFNDIESQYSSKEQEIKINNDTCVKIESELERLKKAYITKKEIIKSVEYYKQRNENIKLLDNIFRGQGFVQYISSIYLQQLCEYANIRFQQMTRGQLSLQLNENNEFEIIDYLNEGRSRSVKTLSGGQAFQVSLSLALALAESVQSNAKADKNFFFIDEGFGTQDSESINIVFETITNLLKDNRIVGIISHVEELKERIPISLTVTKDSEKGSLINMS